MSNINDGGSAFPSPTLRDEDGEIAASASQGMSLRDYFAAKAMNGLLAQSCGTAMGSDPKHAAAYSYLMADAMLKARSQS